MYDSIIIGGGPAGLSAAIYLARKKLKIILISQDFSGQTAKAAAIENYLGIIKTNGPALMEQFTKHLESFLVETKGGEEVKEIKKQDFGFEVVTKNETYKTKTILVCSGKTPRHLDVPGEEEFSGKGVSYCAICDGPLFSDKTVVVIGGGNSALDSAVEMEKYAKKVYIVNLNPEIQGDAILKDRFEKSGKGEIINNAKTKEIFGAQFVKGLKYQDEKGEIKELACDGIFVEIGFSSATGFLRNLVKLNNLKEIEVDKNQATNCEGIFAAGDVTDTPFKQIIIAAGEGATAALSAWKYLITHKINL